MLSVVRSVKRLKCRDLYFCNSSFVQAMGEDVQYFLQSSEVDPHSEPFLTSVIDLTRPLDHLLAAIRKNVAYEIRRANEKDSVEVHVLEPSDGKHLAAFVKFYDSFAASKNLAPANMDKLAGLAERLGLMLSVSTVRGEENEWLSAHAYICDGERARLLYSGSDILRREKQERQLVGRANKLMHWHMIQKFKCLGYRKYDFGGMSKTGDAKSIAEFKESFGGCAVLEYNLIRGISIRGKLAVGALRLQRNMSAIVEKISDLLRGVRHQIL